MAKARRRKKPEQVWHVYMLECARDLIYTGVTPDVTQRYAKHCKGRGAAFTRINPPRRLMASMPCASRSVALKTEAALKKLRRADKLRWALQWQAPDNGHG